MRRHRPKCGVSLELDKKEVENIDFKFILTAEPNISQKDVIPLLVRRMYCVISLLFAVYPPYMDGLVCVCAHVCHNTM